MLLFSDVVFVHTSTDFGFVLLIFGCLHPEVTLFSVSLHRDTPPPTLGSKVSRCQSGDQMVSSPIGQPPQSEGDEGGTEQKVRKQDVTVGWRGFMSSSSLLLCFISDMLYFTEQRRVSNLLQINYHIFNEVCLFIGVLNGLAGVYLLDVTLFWGFVWSVWHF